MDSNGLLLARLQGNLFYESIDNTFTSSEIFIRRFMNSTVAKDFDNLEILNFALSNKEIYFAFEDEFGISSYGKVKYINEVLYWIGYLYRYISYIYNLTSKQVYKLIKPKELNQMYYVYHTFDIEEAIKEILEEKTYLLR